MTFAEADQLYPFDPEARVENLRGPEKLRAFDSPGMRRAVFELWDQTRPKGRDDSERRHP